MADVDTVHDMDNVTGSRRELVRAATIASQWPVLNFGKNSFSLVIYFMYSSTSFFALLVKRVHNCLRKLSDVCSFQFLVGNSFKLSGRKSVTFPQVFLNHISSQHVLF